MQFLIVKRREILFFINICLIFTSLSKAQIWVESYDYTGSSLDQSKWTNLINPIGRMPITTFTGSSMQLQNNTWNLLSYGAPEAMMQTTWYRSLPLNTDWSVIQRIKPAQESDSWYSSSLSTRLYRDWEKIGRAHV